MTLVALLFAGAVSSPAWAGASHSLCAIRLPAAPERPAGNRAYPTGVLSRSEYFQQTLTFLKQRDYAGAHTAYYYASGYDAGVADIDQGQAPTYSFFVQRRFRDGFVALYQNFYCEGPRLQYFNPIIREGSLFETFQMAIMKAVAGDIPEAERLTDSVSRSAPSFAWAQVLRGLLSASRGELDAARKSWLAAPANYGFPVPEEVYNPDQDAAVKLLLAFRP